MSDPGKFSQAWSGQTGFKPAHPTEPVVSAPSTTYENQLQTKTMACAMGGGLPPTLSPDLIRLYGSADAHAQASPALPELSPR